MVQLILPLKGAAFPGLSHFTPVPGFHQRTPVSDSIIRSFLGRFLTMPRRWIIVFALCAQHGTVPTVWRLLLYFCGLLFTCVFPAPSVDSPLVKPSTVPVPWSPPHDGVWFLSLHLLFPPVGVFWVLSLSVPIKGFLFFWELSLASASGSHSHHNTNTTGW